MYVFNISVGGMYLPSSDSGRLIVGTWWLGVLVVVTTYCGRSYYPILLLFESKFTFNGIFNRKSGSFPNFPEN